MSFGGDLYRVAGFLFVPGPFPVGYDRVGEGQHVVYFFDFRRLARRPCEVSDAGRRFLGEGRPELREPRHILDLWWERVRLLSRVPRVEGRSTPLSRQVKRSWARFTVLVNGATCEDASCPRHTMDGKDPQLVVLRLTFWDGVNRDVFEDNGGQALRLRLVSRGVVLRGVRASVLPASGFMGGLAGDTLSYPRLRHAVVIRRLTIVGGGRAELFKRLPRWDVSDALALDGVGSSLRRASVHHFHGFHRTGRRARGRSVPVVVVYAGVVRFPALFKWGACVAFADVFWVRDRASGLYRELQEFPKGYGHGPALPWKKKDLGLRAKEVRVGGPGSVRREFVFRARAFPVVNCPNVIPVVDRARLVYFGHRHFAYVSVRLLVFVFRYRFSLTTLCKRFRDAPCVALCVGRHSRSLGSSLLHFGRGEAFPIANRVGRDISLRASLALIRERVFEVLRENFPARVSGESVLRYNRRDELLHILLRGWDPGFRQLTRFSVDDDRGSACSSPCDDRDPPLPRRKYERAFSVLPI